MEFLETLLIILITVVSIRVLWRYFGKTIIKWLGMKALQRIQKGFEKRAGFKEGQNPFKIQKTGSWGINRYSTLKIKSKEKVGEYIDFEEID